MIVILGYNNLKTEYLNQILESNGLEYKYSLLENDIIQADKIILPHLDNFNSTYRRMNLMNLFSVLRMIKNPILGINNGFRLMCNDLINKYKKGLGFFNFDILCIDGQNNNPNIVEGNLKILENSTLLDSSYNNSNYVFDLASQPEINEFTSVKVSYGKTDFSVLYEYKNYFALAADYDLNDLIIKKIITNFIVS